MAGSSVAVEHVLAGHLVDHGFSSLEGFEGSSLVAGSDELAHLLDGGAVLAAVGGVVFLGTLGQFLLSRQGLIMQMIEVWGNGGC